MRQAMSRAADATATVADRVVGAALKGLISGTQGAADGVREGNQSVAGRPGMAWATGVLGGIRGAAMGIRDGWSNGGPFRQPSR